VSGVLALLALLVLLAAGVPIAFALGGLGFLMLAVAGFSPLMVPQGFYSAIDNFVLLAVPLFLLMSNVLLRCGVGHDLFQAAQSWVGHWPGGLAVATILSCALFSAISGSSVATAATIGTVAIPEMMERGYSRRFVLGLLAAGGTLGILIPPSIPMIIYGAVTEESVLDLFLAGIGPGLLLAALFVAFALAYARFGSGFEPIAKATWAERRRATLRAVPIVVLAAITFGGIYAGAYTPTEAAGVGFAGALLLTGLVQRTLTWARLKEAVLEAMKTTVTIFLIIAGANVMGKAITLYRIPQDISQLVTEHVHGPGLFVLVVCLVLLLLGLVLESLSMLLIMVPVLTPALGALGLDPVWFGVLFVIMIECALITPPVGLNLYVIQAVSKARLVEVAGGVWPFLVLMLITVAAIYAEPQIALYVPFRL
jgi:C4-dicarboxylate transporter DctM subunit